jgi:hypothetical protein
MTEPTDPKLVFMPLDQATAANGMVQVIRDAYWAVCPERGLIFWQGDTRRSGQLRGASPQCNAAYGVASKLFPKSYPWADVRQIDLVLAPIEPRDYC